MRAGLWSLLCATVSTVALSIVGAAPALASGDANQPYCPASAEGAGEASPGFRSFMPDCRSYELVSPSSKAGRYVQKGSYSGRQTMGREPLPERPEGVQFYGEAVGGFAGEPAKEHGALLYPYVFTRGIDTSGWTTSPLAPTLTGLLTPGESGLAFARATTRSGTLWEVITTPAGTKTEQVAYYIREADGSVNELGPTMPHPISTQLPTFGATSEDLRSVAYEIPARNGEALWPGDTTNTEGETSLYELRKGDAEPKLVAVKNQHALSSDQEAEPIGECGDELGGGPNAHENATSADGTQVFFTVHRKLIIKRGTRTIERCEFGDEGEVYARVGGEHTVAISEPIAADCEACNTAEPLAAQYQTASADGSKVFFTTAQELLPGAKGVNLYEYDFNGPEASPAHPDGKVSLVSSGPGQANVTGVTAVSADGSHVYFIATGVLSGANGEGAAPVEGGENLYVVDTREAGPQPHLIGTLGENDYQMLSQSKIEQADVTGNGRFLVFVSTGALTSEDRSTVRQVFEYDAQTEKLTRISRGQRSSLYPGGYNNDGNTETSVQEADEAGIGYGVAAVSENGRRVFFTSSDALTPQALDYVEVGSHCFFEFEGVCYNETRGYAKNVYEYTWTGEDVNEGNVYLISDGADTSAFQLSSGAVELYGTDASGRDVFFLTSDALVPEDHNAQEDIYDARVGGGMPPVASSVPCDGEACLGVASATPRRAPAGSAMQRAGGNLQPRAAHPRHERRRRSRRGKARRRRLKQGLHRCRGRHRRRARRRCIRKVRARFTVHASAAHHRRDRRDQRRHDERARRAASHDAKATAEKGRTR